MEKFYLFILQNVWVLIILYLERKILLKLLESLRMDTTYNLFNKDVEEFLVDFYSYIESENFKRRS